MENEKKRRKKESTDDVLDRMLGLDRVPDPEIKIKMDQDKEIIQDILTADGIRTDGPITMYWWTGSMTYEFKIPPYISMGQVARLRDELVSALNAPQLRLQTPVRGTDTVRIRIPDGRSGSRRHIQTSYLLPYPGLLTKPGRDVYEEDKGETARKRERIREILEESGVPVKGDIEVCWGDAVSRYEFLPGNTMDRVLQCRENLAAELGVPSVRVLAPVPGTALAGVEVPNDHPGTVYLQALLEDPDYPLRSNRAEAVLGRTVDGEALTVNLEKRSGVLVTGDPGSGKSVCLHSMILSLMFRQTPDELRFVLIDTKAEEFLAYQENPMLAVPLITDSGRALAALRALRAEVDRRMARMSLYDVRDIRRYNEWVADDGEDEPMARFVVVIDELEDLMKAGAGEAQELISVLALRGGACGIHLIAATRKPDDEEILTEMIRACIPFRVALKGSYGAGDLCGRGDLLFRSQTGPRDGIRAQGALATGEDAESVTDFLLQSDGPADYDVNLMSAIKAEIRSREDGKPESGPDSGEEDLLIRALRLAVEFGRVSTSLLQRKLKIGYGRSATLIERLEELGFIGRSDGTTARTVLVTVKDLPERIQELQTGKTGKASGSVPEKPCGTDKKAENRDGRTDNRETEICPEPGPLVHMIRFTGLDGTEAALEIRYGTERDGTLLDNLLRRGMLEESILFHFHDDPAEMAGLSGIYLHFSPDGTDEKSLSILKEEISGNISRNSGAGYPVYAEVCVTYDGERFAPKTDDLVWKTFSEAAGNVPFRLNRFCDPFAERIHVELIVILKAESPE